jgi:hypothetical protein
MKKYLFLLFALISVNFVLAQTEKRKTTAPAPKAASLAVAPKLDTKEPSFAGFTGSFINFGQIAGNERTFTMTVEYKPWFFQVSGTANAGYNTPDLGDDAVAVLAYYNAQGKMVDGTDYQAGFFDLMMYLDDEPVKVSNLKFTLIGNATAGSTVLEKAKTWNFELGKIFKMPKYDAAIIKAQAAALDKDDIKKEEIAAKKRATDSIAKEKKRVQDSIAKEEKKRKDSITAHRKYVRDSTEQAEQERKKAIADARKKKRERERAIEEEDEPPPPKKKKKPVVEDDDEPPPPKKKTSSKNR